ncbi:MAG: hypothetical protein HQK49_05965 [Oligoflexia bacterium]|nr:hypothetical protein [Oligoflexia bacterium]
MQFIRDRDNREVDFVIIKDNIPWLLIEAKLAETTITNSLRYFSERLKVPAIQLIWKSGINKNFGNVRLLSASSWLSNLP